MATNRFNHSESKSNISGIDYNSISNMQQLHAAREKLAGIIELKERELEYNKTAFKEAINPLTYINRFIAKLYSMEYLVKYFIKGYDFVKNFFYKQETSNSEQPDLADAANDTTLYNAPNNEQSTTHLENRNI